MKRVRPNIHRILLAAGLLIMLMPATKVAAQDEPTPTPVPQEPQQTEDITLRKDQAPPQTQDQPVVPDEQNYDRTPVNLMTGQSLKTLRSPLHWGHFSLLSVEALQVYDSNFLFRSNNPISAQAGAVQGLLVYAIQTGRSNFSLQYRPQLWVSADNIQTDYASHMVDFHTSRRISPRWAINVSDQYQWSADRGRLDQIGFTSDYSTSTTSQSPFLNTNRRLVSNLADVEISHNLSAHNSVEFIGRHQYIQLSSLPSGAASSTDPLAAETQQQDFGGEVAWNYAWRHDNSIGLRYSYDREYFQHVLGAAEFHSASVGFSRRLFPSLLLRVSGGPTIILPATPPSATVAQDTRLSYSANASLFKTFRRSAMTLSYTRNNNFSGQISDSLNDRYDVTYSQRFFRRADVLIGGAYVRQEYSTGARLLGKSGWAEIDYHFSPSWSFYTSYSYLTQNGGPSLFGPRHLVTSGIRWSWDAGRREAYGR